jgi:hypothetical protein
MGSCAVITRAIVTIALTIVTVGCTINPARYGVVDKYGTVNCIAAGHYASAQAMQDMPLITQAVYQNRANEQALTYLVRGTESAAMAYCFKRISSPNLTDSLAYASSRATALATNTTVTSSWIQDPRRAAGDLAVAYVVYYQQSLDLMSRGQ